MLDSGLSVAGLDASVSAANTAKGERAIGADAPSPAEPVQPSLSALVAKDSALADAAVAADAPASLSDDASLGQGAAMNESATVGEGAAPVAADGAEDRPTVRQSSGRGVPWQITTWLYLKEFAAVLAFRTGAPYNADNVRNALIRNRISLKSMQRIAKERNEAWRYAYRQWIWSHGVIGHRVNVIELFHPLLISVLAFYTYTGFACWRHVEGAFNADTFLEAMTSMLNDIMQPWPLPNSILILDNCGIHHTHETLLREFIELKGGIYTF
ncbi:hypothetical protein T492DRAFT_868616 [Pavlovales sp. CCMP2436]|nr:hypothetical protein T492DRAFT_868616 [Pavlovales sp. CCMP2436]